MSNTDDAVSVNIPFAGFYDSLYSSALDNEEEQFCDYETAGLGDDRELSHPEALRLDAGELAELLFECTDYRKAHDAVARSYVDAFNVAATHALGGFPFAATFEEMTSPREYNFTTDRIFVRVPLATMQTLFERSEAEGHKTLGEVIAGRFTSYDGFHSFYSNDVTTWLEKPIEDWDHNELGTLLIAALKIGGASAREIEDNAFDCLSDCDGLYHEWESAVDWPKFDRLRAEAREEKRQALPPDQRAAVDAYPIRCPNTRDLFTDC
jgi:hypothetical protein